MNDKILFVDDEAQILAGFQRHLRQDFIVVTAGSTAEALKTLHNQGPFSVIVSDYHMPEASGIKLLSEAHKIAPDTVRVMLTGQADLNTAIQAINEGNLFRFLTKPCSPEDLTKTLKASVEQYHLVTAERELLEKTLHGSLKVLADILSILSPVAFSRSSRVRILAKKIATLLNMPKVWEVEIAAMLSQIGFVTLPSETLEKVYRRQKLSESENKMFLNHPEEGRKLIAPIPRLEKVAEAIFYQEKGYDGSGIPADGKKGEAVPLMARILKVVLDFDVLVTTGNKPEKALEHMTTESTKYDPKLFSILNALFHSKDHGGIEKVVSVEDLKPGMTLAGDIKTRADMLLMMKGTELTEIMIKRLLNFEDGNNLAKPILVLQAGKRV